MRSSAKLKLFLYALLGGTAVWIQSSLLLRWWPLGVKPNLPLLVVIVLSTHWKDRWVFVFGALLGVSMDLLSHGTPGVYGVSFFLTALCGRWLGLAIYELNALTVLSAVLGLSLLEGLTALSLLAALESDALPWDWLLFHLILPAAVYQAPLGWLLSLALRRWSETPRARGKPR